MHAFNLFVRESWLFFLFVKIWLCASLVSQLAGCIWYQLDIKRLPVIEKEDLCGDRGIEEQ